MRRLPFGTVIPLLIFQWPAASCQLPGAGAPPVYAPNAAPLIVPPTGVESPLEQMSRECDLGEKRSCFLLGTAYEKGEAPASLAGVIIVRDLGRAAYYRQRGCDLGDAWSCYLLAEQYRRGDGLQKNPTYAASLYTKVCEDRIEDVTSFACTALGSLVIEGSGVKSDFRSGLALFKRSCALGNDSACKLRDVYGGTGQAVTNVPPDGAMGFSFGWSPDEAKTACIGKQGKWLSNSNGSAKETILCNTRVAALDREVTLALEFVNGRLAAIMAFYDVDAEPNGPPQREFARVARLLVETYGLPTERVAEVKDGCTREIGVCVAEKQAEFSMLWVFKDLQHYIQLSLGGATRGGQTGLDLTYATPESVKASGHLGL